ncbi:MAG: LysR family transcriptional regulator [Aestuariivirga sp.]
MQVSARYREICNEHVRIGHFMNETLHWDDLRVFLAVGRARGLAGAVPVTKLSAPTLGRRMLALERALGVSLFKRHRDGYDLTPAGQSLFDQINPVEQGALAIERWRASLNPQQVVRVSAGAWMSVFVARHLPEIVGSDGQPRIELITSPAVADIARREVNLGIRNRRPSTPGLAGRRLVRVEFAIYGAPSYASRHPEAYETNCFSRCEWLAFSQPGLSVPSAVWLEQRLERVALLRCSSPNPLLDAAVSGAGLCVLPCFIGDRENGLKRMSDPIPELGHDQWLVSHDDDRRNRAISLVATSLSRLIRSQKALFAGETYRRRNMQEAR